MKLILAILIIPFSLIGASVVTPQAPNPVNGMILGYSNGTPVWTQNGGLVTNFPSSGLVGTVTNFTTGTMQLPMDVTLSKTYYQAYVYYHNGNGTLEALGMTTPTSQGCLSSGARIAPTSTRPVHWGSTCATAGSQYGSLANAADFWIGNDFDAVDVVELTQSSVSNRVWGLVLYDQSASVVYNKDTPTNTIGFRYSNGPSQDPHWMAYSQGVTTNTIDTGVSFNLSTTYCFGITKRSNVITYYINGTSVATNSAWDGTAMAYGAGWVGTIITGTATHELDFYGFAFKSAMP